MALTSLLLLSLLWITPLWTLMFWSVEALFQFYRNIYKVNIFFILFLILCTINIIAFWVILFFPGFFWICVISLCLVSLLLWAPFIYICFCSEPTHHQTNSWAMDWSNRPSHNLSSNGLLGKHNELWMIYSSLVSVSSTPHEVVYLQVSFSIG